MSNSNVSKNLVSSQSLKIITQYGDMMVIRQGIYTNHHQHSKGQSGNQQNESPHQHHLTNSTRPIIMTFHDLGLNSELQFSSFCECEDVKLMLQTFTMIHVNFIGQECGNSAGENLPEDFKYPNIDQMAECIVDICAQLRIRSFVGLAVGAGAHIVGSLALMRPDLVHGLFLINPIISSCSITEWLYFKMSAIAGGNYHVGDSHHSSHHHSSSKHSHHQEEKPEKANHEHHHSSGLKKLLHAAQNHLPYHHHHHNHQAHNHETTTTSTTTRNNHSSPEGVKTQDNDSKSQASVQEPDGASLTKNSSVSGSVSSVASAPEHQHQHQNPAARLRRMILARNLRANHSDSPSPSIKSSCSGATNEDESGSLMAGASANSTEAKETSKQNVSGKRPPLEYLMYHHFGSATLQRYRRPSSDALISPRDSPQASRSPAHREESNSSRRSSSSLDSGSYRRTLRSNSLCLNASHLASITSDRQRMAYMQRVYRLYFAQINAQNLWLFAHSFAKRRALNLRKDCGAAAHAAAAAAALGTSICTAFVGVTPHNTTDKPGTQHSPSQSRRSSDGLPKDSTASEAAKNQHQRATNSKGANQTAQVAGTKVKRTFTCQTLIMCSSVQLHYERAFKLMSLLNPLQATWIKTDQLLVLEEKPEKVCQALRLFLQGIGYSMSTYERRLRLNSAHGSIGSSADSCDSSRSLNTECLGQSR